MFYTKTNFNSIFHKPFELPLSGSEAPHVLVLQSGSIWGYCFSLAFINFVVSFSPAGLFLVWFCYCVDLFISTEKILTVNRIQVY